jgi:prepilin-type N-terminal cleavage/methylation domain-containing protein
MSIQTPGTDEGFSILEVVIAVALVATAAAGVMDLVLASLSSIRDAREETTATALAVQKVEQLRSADVGLPISPADALEVDTPGFVDRVDAFGASAGGGGGPPGSTIYVRRWSIQSLPSDPTRAQVLRVFVTAVRRAAARASFPVPFRRAQAEALLTTVKATR